jgi:transcription antitermination factor NusG
MIENKKWYAVYTRPRWEKKVAEILTRKKIENYCPINKVVKQWSDRKKIIHEPLFTSYVFVRVSEFELTTLKKTQGIVNLVYWLGKPAVIRNAEIEVIKRFLCEHVNIKLEKTPIHINDKVRVVGGPLMELEGRVLSVKNNSVKVALPSLGYMMFAEVETANVKVIKHVVPTEINMNYPLFAVK